MLKPNRQERRIIEPLVRCFIEKTPLITRFHKTLLGTLIESPELSALVHSFRARIKDPDHLADKLLRKLHECKNNRQKFKITEKNLLTYVTDLAGIRILHLHTTQVEQIDRLLKKILNEYEYEILEGPDARTWDDEYREYFTGIGFGTKSSATLYTSVHYVIGSSSQMKMTCEIQVRTLMEEVWGEVDHTVNYPHKNESVACREQIRALARATSTSTRLVDAIFATVKDLDEKATKAKVKQKKSRRRGA